MDDDRPTLPNGMAMTLATITELSRDEAGYAVLRLHAPELADLRAAGAAPVFKVFIPATPGEVPVLPQFGVKYLPSWEGERRRPTIRSYTAVEFSAERAEIVFLAYDHGGRPWWVDGFETGQTIGVIGFRHEVMLPSDVTTVIAVCDRSAAGAMAALSRQLPDHAALRAVIADGPLPEGWFVSSGTRELVTASADETGFPQVSWAELAPADSAALWLGGEVDPTRRLRAEAIAAGVPATRITAIPYWSRGRTRDEFDQVLSARYVEAAARGVDISDSTVGAELELSS